MPSFTLRKQTYRIDESFYIPLGVYSSWSIKNEPGEEPYIEVITIEQIPDIPEGPAEPKPK
jgi:hypothetical protein